MNIGITLGAPRRNMTKRAWLIDLYQHLRVGVQTSLALNRRHVFKKRSVVRSRFPRFRATEIHYPRTDFPLILSTLVRSSSSSLSHGFGIVTYVYVPNISCNSVGCRELLKKVWQMIETLCLFFTCFDSLPVDRPD